jgi:putative phosphoesterase
MLPLRRIAVISDTHGLLRPEAVAVLRGVSLILHAGDIGEPEVLAGLQSIAPVLAVRGNVDSGVWASDLPEQARVAIGDRSILVVHDGRLLASAVLAATGIDVLVSGHSHQPLIREREGILFVNPGSAGPRRFRLPVSLALLSIGDAVDGEKSRVDAELVELLPGGGAG